jgi:outer membrane protein OmpA-like peptidoglycan-associated protein
MKTKMVALMAVAALGLAACEAPTAENQNMRTGVTAGAILGGVAGAIAGPPEGRLGRAVLGAAIGGVAGGAIGSTLDNQAAALAQTTSGNVAVRNTGSELIVTMPQDLLFATDSAVVRPDLRQDLAAVAANLLQYPDNRIEIIGHTDNTGSAAYNQTLSEQRAQAVASVLRDRGVPSDRIIAYGRGENAPVASNLTPEGRAQNRRVEIIIRPTI